MSKLTNSVALLLLFTLLLLCKQSNSQTQISPRYSVDAAVNSMITKGDTLIVAGNFYNTGIYTGAAALLQATSDKPNLNFPKLIGEIDCSAADGNGGFYVYGNYRRETESVFAASYRIEHVMADFSFEAGFSLPVVSLFKLKTLLFYNGVLYAGGNNVTQIAGQNTGNLSAINVSSKQLLNWAPQVNGSVDGLYASQNTVYITGNFTAVGALSRNGAAAIEMNTGFVKAWNPALGGSYTDIKFYNNKIIIGGGFSDATFTNHACAIIDTVSGQASVQYVFNSANLYYGAGVGKMALRGDTLFAFSTGSFDTRLVAVNLANNNAIIWKKYFNSIAQASDIVLYDNSIYVSGLNIDAIYKTNLTNSNVSDTERTIKGLVAFNTRTGDLKNWFPNPSGLIVHDVYTMSATGNNIFAGGNFSHLNALQRSGVLMLNTTTDEILPFSINIDYYTKEVNALKLIDSTLYLAGNFSQINGQPYNASVISCNIKSGQLLPWHPAKLGNAWAIDGNSKYIFLAGALTEPAGGANRVNLFAIDRQTGALANWAPNPNNYVSTASLHLSKGRLYVGGNFNTISGQTRNNIASYDTTALTLTNWQPVTGNITAISSSDTAIWVGSNSTALFTGINPQTGVVSSNPLGNVAATGLVNSIFVRGHYVIAGGNFKIDNSVCNNLVMYDVLGKALVPNNIFCQTFNFNGEAVNTIALAGNDLYLGGSFTKVNSKINSPGIERIRYPAGFFDAVTDTTYSFYPRSGGNGGDVTINFYGGLINAGTKVKLSGAGLPDIIVGDSVISFAKLHEMKAVANLKGKPLGLYDVTITDSLGVAHPYAKSFQINASAEPVMRVQITGPDLIRTGRPTTFILQITNDGNYNAYGVPLFIFVRGNNTVHFPQNILNMLGHPLPSLMETTLNNFRGETGTTKAYLPSVPEIPANGTYNFPMEINPIDNNANNSIEAIPNRPLIPTPNDVGNNGLINIPSNDMVCYGAIADAIANVAISQLPVVGNAIKCAKGGMAISYLYNKSKSVTDNVNDLGYEMASTAFDCAATVVPALQLTSMAKNTYEVLETGIELGGDATTVLGLNNKCKDWPDPNRSGGDKKNSTSANSVDPNDKTGTGVGSKHYISSNESLLYGIRFENIETALFPAQVVKITDTLDINKMDLSGFQPELIIIGSRIIKFSPGKFITGQNRYTDLTDLRPQMNLYLKTELTLDVVTGVLNVFFTSIDPVTLLPITNPLLGFLPANKQYPEGQGCIYFSVKPKNTLVNKEEIKNKAFIFFDNNAPIQTNVWVNALDKIAPTSQVTQLPAINSDSTFTISWQGTDGESGIDKYNIYYAVNGGSYNPLYLNTNARSASFSGRPDSTYSFYSIATDSAGNREQKNPFDTKTTISSDELKVYPNPNSGVFIVQAKSALRISDLSLYNVQGKRIGIQYTRLNNQFQVTLSNFVPFGIYILKVQTSDKIIGKKIIVKK